MSSGGIAYVNPIQALRQRAAAQVRLQQQAASWDAVRRRQMQLATKARQVGAELAIPALHDVPAADADNELADAVWKNIELARQIEQTSSAHARDSVNDALKDLDPSAPVPEALRRVLKEARTAPQQRREFLLEIAASEVERLNKERGQLRDQFATLEQITVDAAGVEDDELTRMLNEAHSAHERATLIQLGPLLDRIETLRAAREQKVINAYIVATIQKKAHKLGMTVVGAAYGPRPGDGLHITGIDDNHSRGLKITVRDGRIDMREVRYALQGESLPEDQTGRNADDAACAAFGLLTDGLPDAGFAVSSSHFEAPRRRSPEIVRIERPLPGDRNQKPGRQRKMKLK